MINKEELYQAARSGPPDEVSIDSKGEQIPNQVHIDQIEMPEIISVLFERNHDLTVKVTVLEARTKILFQHYQQTKAANKDLQDGLVRMRSQITEWQARDEERDVLGESLEDMKERHNQAVAEPNEQLDNYGWTKNQAEMHKREMAAREELESPELRAAFEQIDADIDNGKYNKSGEHIMPEPDREDPAFVRNYIERMKSEVEPLEHSLTSLSKHVKKQGPFAHKRVIP